MAWARLRHRHNRELRTRIRKGPRALESISISVPGVMPMAHNFPKWQGWVGERQCTRVFSPLLTSHKVRLLEPVALGGQIHVLWVGL